MMRRTADRDDTSSVTPGWLDTLPAGGMVRVDPSVRTAGELVAAATPIRSAA